MKAKRLVCALLVLVMLGSMIPAGFAATGSGPYNPTPAQPSSGGTPVHTHSFGGWKTVKEPTCTEDGLMVSECSGCGMKGEKKIDKTGHDYGKWEITKEPTDHSAGEKQRVCKNCGKIQTRDIYPEGTLRPDDKGDEVEELQRLLACSGYLDEADVDGKYGKKTQKAVQAVQEDKGLEPDGIAWPETTDYLWHRFGEWEVLREPTLTEPGLQHRICKRCGYEEKEEFINGLGPGAKGNYVHELQEILAALGYYDGRLDGKYGDDVKQAVERWQRDHGIEPTGIADDETINRIIEEYLDVTHRQERDDKEEREEPEDEDEPPEDDGEPEDEIGDSITEIPDEAKNKVLGVTAPKVASCHLEFVVTSEPANKKYYMPGEVIQYYLKLINDGDVVITNVDGYYCNANDLYVYENQDDFAFIYKFDCSYLINPGHSVSWKGNSFRHYDPTAGNLKGSGSSLPKGTVTDGNHSVNDKDVDNGEFADFASAIVTFENGETAVPNAELHLPVGNEKHPEHAAHYYVVHNGPKNDLFYTEGEELHFNTVLEDDCDLALKYKLYHLGKWGLTGLFLEVLKGSSGSLGAHEKTSLYTKLKWLSNKTVTADDCENGKTELPVLLAHCTFENGAKHSYLASKTLPCGIENPSASLEIKETSAKDNGEYYSPGETITYDYVLTNTGNIILEYVTLKSKEGGALLNFGTQNLMPGESVTIHSDSKKVTAEMVKAGNTVDVTGYADCVFKSAKGNANADASDAKSFPIGGKPSAKLELRELSTSEKPFYTEGEQIVIGATLTNDGDIDLNSATITASYDGGEAEFVANAGTLAPGESTIEFTALHTVTKEEAQAKKIECTVAAENCSFADGTVLPVSETISFDTGDPALKVDIVVSSTAPDGFYKRNETIGYQVTVSNIGNVDFTHLNTLIFLPGMSKGYDYLMNTDGFAAGASDSKPYTHTVDMDDVKAGTVIADAETTGILEDGTEISASASVTVSTGMLPVNLSIEKVVTSTSTYSFYEENDTITYLITVTNNGKEAIPSVEVSDISPAGATALDIITEMAPGASFSYPYTYTVTGPDVSTGNVHNRADLGAVLPDGSWYTASAEVDSVTGKYVPPAEGGDSDGKGPVVWYLHELVTDDVHANALDQGMEMSITLYDDGRAEIKVNEETTPAFWTENEEAITITAEEKEDLYTKVEDTLENDQGGTLMIFRREKPEPSIKE